MSADSSSTYAGLGGLADKWDASKQVRQRLRDIQALLAPKPKPGEKEQACSGSVAKTRDNLRHNAELMQPLLVMMKDHRDYVPCVNALMHEITAVFKSNGLEIDSATLSDEAWSVRYLYGVVKQLTYKDTPPRVAHFKLRSCGSFGCCIFWRLDMYGL